MEGREQGGVDECRRPKHGRGPDKVFTSNASKAEPEDLGGDGEEERVSEAPGLAVEHALSEDDLGRVGASGCDVCDDQDDGLVNMCEQGGTKGSGMKNLRAP